MKPAFRIVAIPLLACTVSAYALARGTGPAGSGTRAFCFDGRWYAVGDSTSGESVLRNELANAGYAIPRNGKESRDPLDCRIDPLSPIAAKNGPRPLRLPFPPNSFRAHESVGMESNAHIVEIAGGSLAGNPARIRNALVAADWHVTQSDRSGRPYSIGMIKHGKETSVVVLEEDSGSLLILRRMEK